ncbi:MAG: hypothetical protein IJE00_09145 [Clostridia bacterium]|nr:hypothetical protein [Clostridia bacterium]
MMWILFLLLIAVVIYFVFKDRDSTGGKDPANAVPATISNVYDFLHCIYSWNKKSKLSATDVIISYQQENFGYLIVAYVKIFRIDGCDAAEKVDELRNYIHYEKQHIAAQQISATERYEKQRKVEKERIVEFFGTDRLPSAFWDIDDCEYVDGKYLEFEEKGMVVTGSGQGLHKTLDALCDNVRKEYPNATVRREKSVISISL